MTISEKQLNVWANQGTIKSSAATYNSIKTCIENLNWSDSVKYKIYLQGSYKNSTNIRGDSDVDIVVEFTSIFYSNKKDLPPAQLKEFEEYYSNGKHTLASLKKEVIKSLGEYYGQNYVKVGNKSIKVLANSGRLDCDVVCCATYREYKSFSKTNIDNYTEGIVFWSNLTKEKIINFPIYHYENGVSKNKNSSSNYKPSVRIIKNMKSRMVEKELITSSLAPSYFVECLMYNVIDDHYNHTSYSEIIVSILTAFNECSDSNLNSCICQNGQRNLFGASDQQWDLERCKDFISQIIKFWNKGQ